MLKKLFLVMFGNPTLELTDVLQQASRIQANLQSIAKARTEEYNKIQAQIETYRVQQEELDQERQKAERISERIGNLIE